jgi:glucose dehydrogenase
MSVFLRTAISLLAATALLGIVIALPASVEKPAPDWPVFRGNPLQTGVAASTLPEELVIRWKFKAKDSIENAATIVNGMVYVGSMDEHLYGVHLDTGKAKWEYKSGPIKAPPGVHDGAVYVGDLDGVFHCVDAATGTKRWKFDTGSEISSGVSFTSDSVLFGSGDETLYSLTRDGKVKWKFKVPGGPVLGTPAVTGDRTFAAGCDSQLHVLDTGTGKEVGNSVNLGGQVGATVAVSGDQLYVGTMTNQVLGLDWKQGKVLWEFEPPRRQAFYASAAVTDKLVIVGCRDKHVYALDRKTGQQVWSFGTKKKVDGSPVVVGQRVFVGSFDGNLYVLDLATGAELNRFELGHEIAGSPAVGGNCLVIGTTDGTVFCLGAEK